MGVAAAVVPAACSGIASGGGAGVAVAVAVAVTVTVTTRIVEAALPAIEAFALTRVILVEVGRGCGAGERRGGDARGMRCARVVHREGWWCGRPPTLLAIPCGHVRIGGGARQRLPSVAGESFGVDG